MSQKTEPANPGQLFIKDVRFSYCHVIAGKPYKKKGDPDDKAKYSCALIFPKNHPQVNDIKAAIDAVGKAQWGEKYWCAQNPKGTIRPTSPLKDGAEKSHKKGYSDEVFYMNTSRRPEDGPPKVFNPNGVTINSQANANEFPYSGSYGNVLVRLWAQDNEHGKKINLQLNCIVKTKDGEPLAGSDADDESAMAEAMGWKSNATGETTESTDDDL